MCSRPHKIHSHKIFAIRSNRENGNREMREKKELQQNRTEYNITRIEKQKENFESTVAFEWIRWYCNRLTSELYRSEEKCVIQLNSTDTKRENCKVIWRQRAKQLRLIVHTAHSQHRGTKAHRKSLSLSSSCCFSLTLLHCAHTRRT